MNKAFQIRGAKAVAALSLVLATGAGLVACGAGAGAVTDGTLSPPPGGGEVPPAPSPAPDFVRTFQDASNVIGQPAMDVGLGNRGQAAPDETTLLEPSGVAVSQDGSLMFIADSFNRRVLGYRGVPASPGEAAVIVFGRSDFTSGDFMPGVPGALNGTGGVAVGGDLMAVVDPVRIRVLIYEIPSTDGAVRDPIAVVGKQHLDDVDNPCNDRTLRGPRDVIITPDGKLIVADGGGNRVLIWNSVPRGDGVPANAVLGQPGFDTCLKNITDDDLVPSQGSMLRPRAIWSDGTRLAVADTGNNRILLWDNLYTDSGEVRREPDRALGVPHFDRVIEGIPPDAATPSANGVASNGTQLAVATHDRVLIWNSWPSQNMQPANAVLGQPNFEASEANNGLPAPTAKSLSAPRALAFHRDKLLVVDRNNHRVLVFRSE